MKIGYVFEQGRRSRMEDALLFKATLLSNGVLAMAVLCDGMGGTQGGDEASHLFLKEAELWYERELLRSILGKERSPRELGTMIRAKVHRLFRDVNRMLFERMRLKRVTYGTTAVLCIFYRDRYYLFHLGDSRCYALADHVLFPGRKGRNVRIRRLTKDHGNGKGVSKCVGCNPEWKPDGKTGRIGTKSFLFCSDGFYKTQDEQTVSRSLHVMGAKKEAVLERRLRALSDRAMRQGETDNISALWVFPQASV
ncbi:MAG: protein phosphatase 2C domain-containing protein [Lachnospiraceae bacterium]|nr:protein phosphatase 2C domain-containing protein [Lachnospiraceae bacterium]